MPNIRAKWPGASRNPVKSSMSSLCTFPVTRLKCHTWRLLHFSDTLAQRGHVKHARNQDCSSLSALAQNCQVCVPSMWTSPLWQQIVLVCFRKTVSLVWLSQERLGSMKNYIQMNQVRMVSSYMPGTRLPFFLQLLPIVYVMGVCSNYLSYRILGQQRPSVNRPSMSATPQVSKFNHFHKVKLHAHRNIRIQFSSLKKFF